MNNIISIGFSEYSNPKFAEKKNQDWITYGDDNKYPYHLLNLLNTSAKHNAIVNGKANFIVGSGLQWEDEQYQYLAEKDINRAGESINDILAKIALDLEVFGGCYLEVIYNTFNEPVSLYHIDYAKVRSNVDNTEFYISEQWETKGKPDDIITIKAYDGENTEGKKIIYLKEYRPNVNTYTLPSYQGALNYIELDVAVSEFHLNAIHNGLMPSKMISFNNGTPSVEEQRTIERQLKEKFAGEKNAGKFIINFNNDPSKAPTVLDLSASDLDKQFDLLNRTIQQEIFSGHRVTSPLLFGIATEGALGNRNEIREAYQIFQNTYINGKQIFIERWLKYILAPFGYNTDFTIKETEPLAFEFSEAVLSANMTQDEIREKLGLPVIVQKLETSQQDVINGINSLSPLVANKVLESMTPNEIRALIGLLPKEEGQDIVAVPNTPQAFKAFTKEDDDFAIAVFSEFGQDADKFFVINSKPMRFDAQGRELHDEEFAGVDIIITTVQSSVLDLIRQNPLISAKDISEALKVDRNVVNGAIASLEANKLIIQSEINDNGTMIVKREITKEGRVQRNERKPLADVKIYYQYEVNPSLGQPEIIDTTRDFCKNLIDLRKVFTRAEIEQVSQRLGYSVWQRRGGFYTNPKTQITTPYCRHIWVKKILVEKR
jgi:DNA-binding MarR family transcriptional regulator